MGFWNKFGKIALQAAPYVAAPFTGGASLYAIPATQKIGAKWSAHDAQKNIDKGLAPSKFDRYLGMASNVAGMASGTGLLGKGMTPGAGSNAGPGSMGEKLGSLGNYAADMMGPQAYPQQGGLGPTNPYDIISDGPNSGGITGNMPRPGQNQPQGKQQYGQMPSGGDMRDPAHGMFGRNFGIDQNNPNLAPAIAQGRVRGLRDTGQLPPSRFQRRLA